MSGHASGRPSCSHGLHSETAQMNRDTQYRAAYTQTQVVGIQQQTWLAGNCFGQVVSAHEGIYNSRQCRGK